MRSIGLKSVSQEGGFHGILLGQVFHAVRQGLILEFFRQVLDAVEFDVCRNMRIERREILGTDGGEHRLDVGLARRDVMSGEFAGDFRRVVGQLSHDRIILF